MMPGIKERIGEFSENCHPEDMPARLVNVDKSAEMDKRTKPVADMQRWEELAFYSSLEEEPGGEMTLPVQNRVI
jgi:hypothetical protein